MANYSSYPDEYLLSPLASGEVPAFEELYSRYWQSMYRFAWNFLKDEAVATDIVQDIFLWLWSHRETVRITHVRSYLHAAVKFKAANHIRSGKVRDSFFRETVTRGEGYIPSVEEDLEIRELRAIIDHAISLLPGKCREIFLLSRDKGFSHREIAEQLGLSVKTVENQVGIALKKIRTSIDAVSDDNPGLLSGDAKMALLDLLLLTACSSSCYSSFSA